MYIDCFWIAGQLKGNGYANLLLEECIRDSKEKGKKGGRDGTRRREKRKRKNERERVK